LGASNIKILKDKKKHKKVISDLIKKGYFVADMHAHTIKTDGCNSLNVMAEKAKEKGIYLAITDHNDVPDYLSLKLNNIIPGIEVKTTEKIDVLVYFDEVEILEQFHNKHIKPKKRFGYATSIPLKELLSILQDVNCVVSIAHPLYPKKAKILSRLKKLTKKELSVIDSIEVFNSLHEAEVQKEAVKATEKLGKNICVGTDAHTTSVIGNAVHYCKAKNKKEFLTKFKNGKTKIIAIKTPRIIDTVTNWAVIWFFIREVFLSLKKVFR